MEVTALYEIRRPGSADLYVGISTDPVQRWRAHKSYAKNGGGTRLARSLRKHGFDAFTFTVVAGFPSRTLALLAERGVVARQRPNLNTSSGGDASPMKSPETRAKISAARKRDPEATQAHLQTPEARAKRSASMKGRPPWPAIHSAKRRLAQKKANDAVQADPVRRAAHAAATSAGRRAAMADPVRKALWLERRRANRAAKKASL